MKILILYTARSGSNSIAKYFIKQNPNFMYFNQPWSLYTKEGIKKIPYKECISYDNVLVKCEIFSLKNTGMDNKIIINSFDKIVLLSRKNKKEQAISYIIAGMYRKFIDGSKKKYYVNGIDETLITIAETTFTEKENEMQEYLKYGAKMFYYEDLFYGEGFTELLQFLNLKHIPEDFDEILDSKNRYKVGVIETKQSKTLI